MRRLAPLAFASLLSVATGCTEPEAEADAAMMDAPVAELDAAPADDTLSTDGALDPDASTPIDAWAARLDAARADAPLAPLPDAPFDASSAGCDPITLPEISADNTRPYAISTGVAVDQFLGTGADGTGFGGSLRMYAGPMPALGVASPMDERCASGGACVAFRIDGETASFAIERGVISFSWWEGDAIAGEHSDIVVRETMEVPLGGGAFEDRLAPGGRCHRIAARTFDTRTDARACIDVSQCRGGLTCDAELLVCGPTECSDAGGCGVGEMCRAGTCMRTCRAGCIGDTTCESGGRTLSSASSGGWNACVRHGEGVLGSAALVGGVYSSCAPGLAPHGGVCARACDPLLADPGCDAMMVCVPPGVCAPPLAPGPALGEACAATDDRCGLDGDAYRGRCVPLLIGGALERRCARYCDPEAPSCASGQTCRDVGFELVCAPD